MKAAVLAMVDVRLQVVPMGRSGVSSILPIPNVPVPGAELGAEYPIEHVGKAIALPVFRMEAPQARMPAKRAADLKSGEERAIKEASRHREKLA